MLRVGANYPQMSVPFHYFAFSANFFYGWLYFHFVKLNMIYLSFFSIGPDFKEKKKTQDLNTNKPKNWEKILIFQYYWFLKTSEKTMDTIVHYY